MTSPAPNSIWLSRNYFPYCKLSHQHTYWLSGINYYRFDRFMDENATAEFKSLFSR